MRQLSHTRMGEWGQERVAEAGAGAEAMENEYVELAKTQKPLKGSMPRAGAPLLVKCIKSLQKPICISADGLRWRPGDYQNANMAQSGSKTYLKCP